MRFHRGLSLSLMLVFAATGLLFLFFPSGVVAFFDSVSASWGMPKAATGGTSFYVVLSVGYMYVVTLLAFMMYRHPGNRIFPFLLINAKASSSLLSLALFLVRANYFIYLANFIVDGAIAAAILVLYLNMRRTSWVSS